MRVCGLEWGRSWRLWVETAFQLTTVLIGPASALDDRCLAAARVSLCHLRKKGSNFRQGSTVCTASPALLSEDPLPGAMSYATNATPL